MAAAPCDCAFICAYTDMRACIILAPMSAYKSFMDSPQLIVSLVALVGTLAGTFAGILTSTRLTTYRIEQLEKKVEKHNTLIERTYKLEREKDVIDEKPRQLEQRLVVIEEERGKQPCPGKENSK